MKVFIVGFIMMGLNIFAGNIDIIAKTLYHEARGEGETGIRAVASVIHNRSLNRYKKTSSDFYVKEVKRRLQFSCWNGKKDLSKGNGSVWQLCLKVAHEMNSGDFKPLHKHTHYYAYKKCNPKWARNVIGVIIGNHKFLTV